MLLISFVSLNPPNFNNATEFLALLSAPCVFLENPNSRPYRDYLIQLAQHRGTYECCLLLFSEAQGSRKLANPSHQIYVGCIGIPSLLMMGPPATKICGRADRLVGRSLEGTYLRYRRRRHTYAA